MSDEVEIGYLCRRGHFDFQGEGNYGMCGSKSVASVFVRKDPEVEFYPPEPGDCGYTREDYESNLRDAVTRLLAQMDYWEKR